MKTCYGKDGMVLAIDHTDEIMAYLAGDTHALDYLESEKDNSED